MTDLSVYDNDPTLYLFTSLTAGSSHIITATSRIETILKANKIPFKGVDTATDDLARKLYGRRASGKKLPLLVKEGYVLGDLEEIEEWNEYGELKEALGVTSAPAATKSTTTASTSTPKREAHKENEPSATSEQNLAIRQLGAEAAKVAASKKPAPTNITTTNPLLAEKVNSPAASTPKKSQADKEGILSPRSIPLPSTPSVAESARSPKETVKSPTSPGQLHRSHSGAEVQDASEEEIKRIEKEQAIAEVSSSEEEDDEDEKKAATKATSTSAGAKAKPPVKAETKSTIKATEQDEEEEDDDEEDEDEEEDDDDDDDDDSDDEEEDEKELQPQKQDPKAAEKAGESVED